MRCGNQRQSQATSAVLPLPNLIARFSYGSPQIKNGEFEEANGRENGNPMIFCTLPENVDQMRCSDYRRDAENDYRDEGRNNGRYLEEFKEKYAERS